jgi:hypothetical protein
VGEANDAMRGDSPIDLGKAIWDGLNSSWQVVPFVPATQRAPMLTIRPQQLEVLAQTQRARFAAQAVERVALQFGATYEALGPSTSRELVNQCIQGCLDAGFRAPNVVNDAIDHLFRHRARVTANPTQAIRTVILELEASALLSILET